jgi:hypothetical protein
MLKEACTRSCGALGCNVLCARFDEKRACARLVELGAGDAHAREVIRREAARKVAREGLDRACSTLQGCEDACNAGNWDACLLHARSFVDHRYSVVDEQRSQAIYRRLCDATDGRYGCLEVAEHIGPNSFARSAHFDGDDVEYFSTNTCRLSAATMAEWSRLLIRACDSETARSDRDRRACGLIVQYTAMGPSTPRAREEGARHLPPRRGAPRVLVRLAPRRGQVDGPRFHAPPPTALWVGGTLSPTSPLVRPRR